MPGFMIGGILFCGGCGLLGSGSVGGGATVVVGACYGTLVSGGLNAGVCLDGVGLRVRAEDGEDGDSAGKAPGDFLDEVVGAAYAHDLV